MKIIEMRIRRYDEFESGYIYYIDVATSLIQHVPDNWYPGMSIQMQADNGSIMKFKLLRAAFELRDRFGYSGFIEMVYESNGPLSFCDLFGAELITFSQ